MNDTNKNEMLVTQVRIKNVLGIDEFSVEPGRITILSGRNGAGKSSTIKAIQNAIGGGSLAELKNLKGNGDAEIVLHMEGDDGKYILTKDEKKTKLQRQVGDTAAFEDVKAPQKFLSSLYDNKMSNPVEFLRAKDKERVHLLLEAMELPFDTDELWGAMGIDRSKFPAVPAGMHPLSEIGMHRENVFRERTGVNRDEKQKRATCEQTRRSVPAEIPTVESLDEKESQLSDAKVKKAEFVKEIEHKCQAAIQGAQVEFEEFEKKEELDLERFKEKAKAKMEREIAEYKDAMNADAKDKESIKEEKKEDARKLRETELKEIEGLDPEITALEKEIAVIRERSDSIIKITTLHEQADKFEKESNELREYSQALTEAIGALDNYKANMCSDLPIPGLDITDNVITVDGVKWDQLNTAKQVEIAVTVACMRSVESQLPIVWVDGAESLDDESFEMLRCNLENANVQAFIGRVGNHDLSIDK